MVMADDYPANELASRQPTVEDLRDLCRELNQRGAKYVVIGGFAIRAAEYVRETMAVDLINAADTTQPGSTNMPRLRCWSQSPMVTTNRPHDDGEACSSLTRRPAHGILRG